MSEARPVGKVEIDVVTPYLMFLFVLLSTATLFDGFDSGLLSFAAPESRRTLDISKSEWGFVNSIVRLGVMASFLFLLTADRWGRRTSRIRSIEIDRTGSSACRNSHRGFL